jgi:UDP-glucose 4-epimerase
LQRGAKKIIFASSGGTVYGNAKIIPTPEDYPLDPISPYGASKAACEFYLKILCQKFGADLLILRYANVYGPKQRPDTDAGVISIFANLMKKGEDVYIYGNGEQTRDYIHISDALNFTLEVFRKNLTGVFNVGTGVETSVNKIFNLLKDILNYKKAPIYKKPIYGEVLRSALNIQKIVKSLDIYPKMKIEEGIKTLFY